MIDFMLLLSLCVHYSLTVFAAGLIFGFIRVTVLLPQFPSIEESRWILTEIPIMLTISWFVAKKTISDAKKKPVVVCHNDYCERKLLEVSLYDMAVMGSISFFYLQVYEFLVAKYMGPITGLTIVKFVIAQCTYPANIGLCGQLGFAVIPVLQHLVFSDNNKVNNASPTNSSTPTSEKKIDNFNDNNMKKVR